MKKIIILDCHGGDNSPDCVLKGAAIASQNNDLKFHLVGNREIIETKLKEFNITLPDYELTHTDDIISMDDEPTSIIKSKKNCSMAVGLKLLADNKGEAFISAGSTGALLTGSTLFVKRIKGIKRAAMAPLIPTLTGNCLLIDCGANTENTPEFLYQYALLGDIYSKHILNIKNPKIGLLNNGTEETKGTQLYIDTYSLLKNSSFNFIGNIEAKEAMLGGCDVLVADGFTGNIFLKTVEGTASVFSKFLKEVLYKNTKNKAAALILKSDLNNLKKKMSGDNTGGAPFLGISKPVFKAHGSSDEKAISYAIKDAYHFINSKVIEKISIENLFQ